MSSGYDSTLGALFVGFAIACCIYGVLAAQVFSYFRHYHGDRWHLKLTVITIFLLETADQMFIGHMGYYYCITYFANPLVLLSGTIAWSLILQITMGAVVGTIVKVSFGLRVWRFSQKNYWITGIIMILSFGQLGTAVGFTVKAFQLPNLRAVDTIKTLGTISLALGVATDIVTAAALCFFLNRLRTGLAASDSLVNSLLRYAINTGALTAACSLTTLLLYNFKPGNNLYFIAVYFTVSKMYAISYMATLNTRRTVRGRGTDRQGGTTGRQDNNTNLFHLGTRVPSVGPVDLGGWSYSDKVAFREDDFPLNSFAPSQPYNHGPYNAV